MDFEQELKQLCQVTTDYPDPDDFIDRLRGKQVALQRRKQRLFMGATMIVFIAFVGLLTVTQLQSPVNLAPPNSYYSDLLLTADEEQQLWEDMTLYVLENEEDLWTALEFFNDVDLGNLTNLMEVN